MRYQVELSHVKWKKCMQMQMAMHCAPVLAGLKPSNAVTLDYIDSKELIQSLAGSDIKCGLIYSGNGKCLWLLYREQQVNPVSDGSRKPKISKTLRLFILSDSKYPLYT